MRSLKQTLRERMAGQVHACGYGDSIAQLHEREVDSAGVRFAI